MKYNSKIEQNGVIFYMRGASGYCMDIDVDENTEEIRIPDEVFSFSIRNNTKKSFKNVKSIYIGKNVNAIKIPNSLFPNVRKVVSASARFLSGGMIVSPGTKNRVILLNSFCLNQNEVLNLDKITDIDFYALDECEAGKVINSGTVKNVSASTLLRRSKLPAEDLMDTYGIMMVGKIIVKFRDDGRCCIPEDAEAIANDTCPPYNETLTVKHNKAFFNQEMDVYPDNIIFDASDHIDMFAFKRLRDVTIEFGSNMKEYVKKDRIIYTKDMKILCSADTNIEGHVTVPDTVKSICVEAFSLCNRITSVMIPDSVRVIGAYAFASCGSLKRINIGENVKNIGMNCFTHDTSLEELVIPGSVKKVEPCILDDCPSLKRLTFEEGVRYIGITDINSYESMTLKLPSTIKRFSSSILERSAVLILNKDYVSADIVQTMCKDAYRIATYKGYLKPGCSFSYDPAAAVKGEILCIKTPSRTYYLPVNISYTNIDKIAKEISRYGVNTPANFYQYCERAEQKPAFAFMEYQTQQDEKTKNFLKRNRKIIVNDLIKAGMQDEIVMFLKWGILSKPMLKDVYDMLSETELVAAKAYAMELLGSQKSRFTEG